MIQPKHLYFFFKYHTTLRTDSAPRPMLMHCGLSQMVFSVTSSLVSCRGVMSWRTSLLTNLLSRLCQESTQKKRKKVWCGTLIATIKCLIIMQNVSTIIYTYYKPHIQTKYQLKLIICAYWWWQSTADQIITIINSARSLERKGSTGSSVWYFVMNGEKVLASAA